MKSQAARGRTRSVSDLTHTEFGGTRPHAPERARNHAAPLLAVLLASIAGLSAAGFVFAAETASVARVVWARGSTLYLAATDSASALEGRRLDLMRGRRRVAIATVTRIVDGTLAVARVDSGSVEPKRMDRLRVVARAELGATTTPSLRVGLPSSRRPSLVSTCPDVVFVPPVASEYRREAEDAGAWRWVRIVPAAVSSPWPDTIVVRTFADAGDEDIAFERGELDLALFWPGEVTPRTRNRLADDFVLAHRARGVLAVQPAGTSADSAAAALAGVDLTRLNDRLFRGDLAPWPRSDVDSTSTPRAARVRVRPDASMPGARAIERALADDGSSSSPVATVRLLYLDTPAEPADVVEGSLRALGVSPRYAMRGGLLVGPRARAFVHRIGAATLLARWGCDAAELVP